MQEILKNWLNSRKDYFQGVAIYEQFNPDEKLLAVLNNGPNEFRQKRLVEELLKIYQNFLQPSDPSPAPAPQITQNANLITPNANKIAANAKKILSAVNAPTAAKNVTQDSGRKRNESQIVSSVVEKSIPNPQLYAVCKEEADNEYKKVMNVRAVLFKKAAPDGFLDINKPDLIFDRGELAIEVVQGFQKVSELYDRANYVKQHGRLPSSDADLEDDNEYDLLPDSLVKQRLDNARKAYNKLKKKERTPERVALLQQHEQNIAKLKAKWDSLQPSQ